MKTSDQSKSKVDRLQKIYQSTTVILVVVCRFFLSRNLLTLLPLCNVNLFQQDYWQFLFGPSVQGSGKPQGGLRGFLLKIGEGGDERQSEEGECKHCNDVTPVKLTPESILLPISREQPPWHGRIGDLTDQCGLLKAKMKYGWNPIFYSLTWLSWLKPPPLTKGRKLVRPDRMLVWPSLAWPGLAWHSLDLSLFFLLLNKKRERKELKD